MKLSTHQSAISPSPFLQTLDDNNHLVNLIAEVTNQPIESVRQRLYEEEVYPGINVTREFQNRALVPHIWSEQLIRFYNESDAFLYQLVFWNRNPIKLQMLEWIGKYLSREGTSLDILCFGDGLGFDSLYLAQAGHCVTYYDVPGFSEAFARQIFKNSNCTVQIVTNAEAISKAAFDVVLCLDVLEHVPDPPSFVAIIASYLRPGGRAIIHAPFYEVNESHLSHLQSNQRYSGRLNLFTKQGLQLIDGQIGWNPIVLCKADQTTLLPSWWNLHLWRLRLMGFYIAVASRVWGNPFWWVSRKNDLPNSIKQI